MNETEQVHWRRWRGRGDEDAFGALVRPHLGFATDFARRLGCGLADADEVVQRCLVRLSAARDDRPSEVGLRAWMGRTILSEVKMLRRASRRRRTHEGRAPSREVDRIEAIDLRDQMEALLATLESRDRAAVTLRYLHDLEYREVAYILGITPGAARTRVHRAIERLRRNLGQNASAMIAALPLLCGKADGSGRSLLAAKAVSAHPWFWITGGVMGVGMKLTVAGGAAALLALLLSGGTSTREDAGPRANRMELGEEHAPIAPVGGPSESVAASLAATVFRALPVAEGERPAFLADTQVAELIRMNRDMREEAVALFEELGRKEEPPRPDPITRRYLESLVARYRSLEPGVAREEVLRGLSDEIWDYLESTGDTSFLEFVEEVAQDEAGMRILGGLLFATHPDVVALLERLSRHPDAMVRLAAVTNLCSVGDRAHPAVLAALGDPSPRVRWSAALFVYAEPGDAAPVELLLDRLEAESHPFAALAMGGAIARLDPVSGSSRIGKRLQELPGRTEWYASLSEIVVPSLDDLPESFRKPPSPEPDPVTANEERARMVGLIESYQESKTPESRVAALEKLGEAHDGFVRRTGSTAHVEFLESITRDAETPDERAVAARVLRDDLAVLTRLARSPHPEVRREAASNLGRLPRKQHEESLRELLRLLDDPDDHVRMRVAIALAGSSRRTAVPQLLAALGRELDRLPAIALVQAIERLDPEKGRERILKEIDRSSGETRVLVLGVLEIRDRRER